MRRSRLERRTGVLEPERATVVPWSFVKVQSAPSICSPFSVIVSMRSGCVVPYETDAPPVHRTVSARTGAAMLLMVLVPSP